MVTRENTKQVRFFLRLLSSSLVSGVALATIIASSLERDSLGSGFLSKFSEKDAKVRLNVLNPEYLEINFGLRGLDPEPTKGRATKGKYRGRDTKNVFARKSPTKIKRAKKQTLVSKQTLVDKQAKERRYSYKIAQETVVTNDLTTSEFIELQEMMLKDQFAYEQSDQYIAEKKAEEENRNTKKLLAALKSPQKKLDKISDSISINVAAPKRVIKSKRVTKLKRKPKEDFKEKSDSALVEITEAITKVRKVRESSKKNTIAIDAKIEKTTPALYTNAMRSSPVVHKFSSVSVKSSQKSSQKNTQSTNHPIQPSQSSQPPVLMRSVPAPPTSVATQSMATQFVAKVGVVSAVPVTLNKASLGKASVSEVPVSKASLSESPVLIKGILTGSWKQAKGHYEVGFYSAIDSFGEPIGAPTRVEILPSGRRTFKLQINAKAQGYVFARLYPAKGSKSLPQWHSYGKRIDVAQYDPQSLLSVPIQLQAERQPQGKIILANTEAKRARVLKGRVRAMFSNANAPLWITGTRVRLRGTNMDAVTNQNGHFELETSAIGGRALLEILAPGYLPRVVEASFDRSYKGNEVELASRSTVKHLARSLGIAQSDELSLLVIDTGTINGVRLPGVSTQLSLKAQGPFYFNNNGFPDRALASTTENGKLIYFNVEPGIGFLETFVLGQTVSPVVVSVLDGNEFLHKKIRFSNHEAAVKGKLFDPVESQSGVPLPISGSKVRIAGSADWTETDSFGSFELPMLRYVEGSEILLEVSAPGYYKHRFSFQVSAKKALSLSKLKLFVFPKKYISELARSVDLELNPDKGLLMGKISLEEKVRIDTLSEHSSTNLAKDYYFDENNILRGSYAFTQPRNGLFSVFNVSPGRALLHGYNPDGALRYSGISYFSPSTVNVIID